MNDVVGAWTEKSFTDLCGEAAESYTAGVGCDRERVNEQSGNDKSRSSWA